MIEQDSKDFFFASLVFLLLSFHRKSLAPACLSVGFSCLSMGGIDMMVVGPLWVEG